MQYYNSVVDVLEWGASTWHDVPTSDRGVIFLKTFVRAIKRIRMEAYLSVCLGVVLFSDGRLTLWRLQALTEYDADPDNENPEFSVDELIDMANKMVEETTGNPPKEGDDTPMDKGAWYSFHVFPVADAHAYVSLNPLCGAVHW